MKIINIIKKIIIVFMICIFFITSKSIVLCDDINEEENDDFINVVNILNNDIKYNKQKKEINSKNAVILDRKTKRVLYGKDENDKVPMASTTKIMTAIILVENGNLNNIIKISKKAAGTGGSRLGLKENDVISVQDLLYGLMLRSGNDAAVAIAEYISGNIPDFVILMNNKAKELELKKTHFVTPHGLDNNEHYTTAYELALITDYALKNDVIKKIVSTKYYTILINGQPKNLKNTNELLGVLNGVYGVKTGFTNNAGRCLVTAIKRDDLDIISVVLGADTKRNRTKDSINLISYIYQNYKYCNIKNNIESCFNDWYLKNKDKIKVIKGKEKNVELYIDKETELYPLNNDEKDNIKFEVICYTYNIVAPVYEDLEIGKINIKLDDKIIGIEKIKIKNRIYEKDILDYLKSYTKVFYDGYIFNNI